MYVKVFNLADLAGWTDILGSRDTITSEKAEPISLTVFTKAAGQDLTKLNLTITSPGCNK